MADAVITIKGKQTDIDSKIIDIELMTEGKLFIREKSTFITYQETEMTGMEGTNTVMKIQGGTITITRQGSVNTQMEFEEGKRHLSYYETPYGGFTVEVYTYVAQCDMTDTTVNVVLRYEIVMNDERLGESTMNLKAVAKG